MRIGYFPIREGVNLSACLFPIRIVSSGLGLPVGVSKLCSPGSVVLCYRCPRRAACRCQCGARSESYERGCAPARYRGGVADQRKNSPRRSSTRRSPSGGSSGRAADRTSRAAGATSSNNVSSCQRTVGTAASARSARGAKAAGTKVRGTKTASTKAASGKSKRTSSGGPRPPVNLWPRRIITGLGLILILALIVWGVVALVRAVIGVFTSDPVPQSSTQSVQSGTVDASGYTLKGGQEATADGLLTDGTAIEIPVCLDKDIAVTATASEASVGSPLYVSVTLENRGSVACSTSLSNYTLQVSTGGHQVYDSARCAADDESAKTLLLRPTGTWSGWLSWDGYVYVDGCTSPAGGAKAATVGTYKLAIQQGSREVGSAVADITAPPAPQSGAQSGAQSGQKAGTQAGTQSGAQSGTQKAR